MSDEILQGPALHEKIAEVMRRREDYWVEFEVFSPFSAQWVKSINRTDMYESMERGWDFRHRPPKVKLEGEVEPEVIATAKRAISGTTPRNYAAVKLAEALLACAKHED